MKKIAYLGPKTTYTHEASLKYFTSNNNFIPARRIKNIFSLLTTNQVDYGVVPAENSTGGTIYDTLDLLIQTDIKIYDQITLKIRHNLLSRYSTEQINKIFSHPQSFIQCAEYLEKKFNNVELIDTLSNAEAANLARTTDHSAAIASQLCAQEYSLNILDSEINDNLKNETKFFVLTKKSNNFYKDKSLIIISIINKIGGLFNILKTFNKFEINMTKIESRPSKIKNWDYVFIIEYENPEAQHKNQELLNQLQKNCEFVDYLGSY